MASSEACVTRPSTSASGLATGALPSASDLQRVRAARRQAYHEKQGCACCRRHPIASRAFALVTAPCLIMSCVLRIFLRLVISLLQTLVGALLQPHFWFGAALSLAASTSLLWESCHELPAFGAVNVPGIPGVTSFVCKIDNPRAAQVRDAFLTAASTFSVGRTLLQDYFDTAFLAAINFADTCRARAWFLFGSCPFASIDDAVGNCAGQHALEEVRHATDCGLLRRAFREGQRQFHPDHLRTRYPSCEAGILEACSVALNGAMEARRAELNCPGR